MNNTENDYRDYFQTMQNTQMTNYKTIEELNYLNALNDKFQFDGQGFKQIGKSDTAEDMANKVKASQVLSKSGGRMKYGGRKKKY